LDHTVGNSWPVCDMQSVAVKAPEMCEPCTVTTMAPGRPHDGSGNSSEQKHQTLVLVLLVISVGFFVWPSPLIAHIGAVCVSTGWGFGIALPFLSKWKGQIGRHEMRI
jgi:hypothetical protein